MAPTSSTTSTLQLKRETAADRFFRNPDTLSEASTPSLWFSRRYPAEADRYGCPMLEQVVVDAATDLETVTPLHLNDCFFAAILSDQQLGHSVVYYETEQQWYFNDPRDGLYHPTTEAKMMNLLSALLTRCAEEMPKNVDVEKLFIGFRQEELLKSVVKKARSLLAADSTFFSATSPNRRIEGPESHQQTARRFINVAVKPKEGRLLSVNECYNEFTGFCRNNGVEAVERRFFKQLVAEIIKEEFGLGLRADLKNDQGRYQRGWKGLAVEMDAATRN